jgi:hypothetical protein
MRISLPRNSGFAISVGVSGCIAGRWCDRVSAKLENKAFFTRADQLHFDQLGFVPQIAMTRQLELDQLLGQLREKFDRLRDVINWVQQRRR